VWIAVCDDEKIIRDDLKNAVYAYSNMHRLDIIVDEYLSGEKLLSSGKEYDIVFLDYKMSGINGLETAKTLRMNNVKSTIIFLTSNPYFVFESFEVNPFRFFEKPLDTKKLYSALDKYFHTIGNDYPILLKIGRETVCVKTNDVVYLEADNKKCYVNLFAERLHCAKTMSAVVSFMPKEIFFKVHKAFTVNFNYISNYDKENIYFKNNEHVPISRKFYTEFKEAYLIYVKGRSM